MASQKGRPPKGGAKTGRGGKPTPDGYWVRIEVLIVAAAVALVIGYIGRGVLEGSEGAASKKSVQSLTQSAAPSATAPPLSPAASSAAGLVAGLLDDAKENPEKADGWTRLGNAYFDSGQYELAIDAYRRSLEIEPRNPDVLTDMGIMYRRTGHPDDAIAAFEEAMGISPEHEMSRFNKGVVLLYDLQNRSGALEVWEQLAKTNPRFAAPNGQLITALVESIR